MARPFCCRRIAGRPPAAVFKPAGVPVRELEEIVMSLDEFEAIRLVDLNGLYHEQAAALMKVSRPTLGRIVTAARRKLADSIVHGKALRFEGGPVRLAAQRCCRAHDAADRSAAEEEAP